MSVLSAGGVTPVKGTQDQLLQALYKLLQAQKATAFSAAGTATVLTLTPSPAISAYATNQRFTVKFPVNSGLNPTLNVSGKGAKNLKQYDATGAKIAATFFADQVSDVMYDGTDLVLLAPISSVGQATESNLGALRVASQPQTNAGSNDTTAITPQKLIAWATSGVTAATEALFGFAKVATQAVVNSGTDDATIVTPKKLKFGVSYIFSTNGYLILPSWLGGLIFQWGRMSVAPEGSATINYPVVFPSAVLASLATINRDASTTNGNYSAYANALSNSQIVITNDVNVTTGSASQFISWFSIGF